MASRSPSMRTASETLAATSKLYAQSHAPRPTSAPKFDLARRGLQARLLENVCGWNEKNIPRTCGANSYCAFIPDYWGCCGVDSEGVFYADCVIGTACLDYAAYTASCEPNDCGASVVWCGASTVPYCEPELLQVQIGGSLTTSTSWRCASIRTSEILQSTSSQTTSTSSTTTTSSSTSISTPGSTNPPPAIAPATTVIIISVENGSTYSSSVKITSSVATDSPGTAAAGAVGGGTSAASSGGPKPSAQPAGLSASSSTASVGASSGKPSNTGSIAGGVVGGVIFIALIAGLIFLLKKKSSARQPKTEPSDVSSISRTMPDSSFPTPDPKELHSPANYDKIYDSGISELHSPPQYSTQHPALSQSNLAELESSRPGPRTSYYKPGQQTRPQQELSDVNYPSRISKHFQIELPG